MKSFSTDPRFNRAGIGFDRVFGMLESFSEAANAFPPHDIEKIGDDEYRITLAVAGFTESDLDISVENDVLTVKGSKPKEEDRNFVHRGIAHRSFERRFQLAEHVEVKSAGLSNGLLAINLVREVPEAKKARKVSINA